MWKLLTLLSLPISLISLYLTGSIYHSQESRASIQSDNVYQAQLKDQESKIQLLQQNITILQAQLKHLQYNQSDTRQTSTNKTLEHSLPNSSEPTPLAESGNDQYQQSENQFNNNGSNPVLTADMDSILKQDLQTNGLDADMIQAMECRGEACRFELVASDRQEQFAEPLHVLSMMTNLPVPATTKAIDDGTGRKRLIVYFNQQ